MGYDPIKDAFTEHRVLPAPSHCHTWYYSCLIISIFYISRLKEINCILIKNILYLCHRRGLNPHPQFKSGLRSQRKLYANSNTMTFGPTSEIRTHTAQLLKLLTPAFGLPWDKLFKIQYIYPVIPRYLDNFSSNICEYIIKLNTNIIPRTNAKYLIPNHLLSRFI